MKPRAGPVGLVARANSSPHTDTHAILLVSITNTKNMFQKTHSHWHRFKPRHRQFQRHDNLKWRDHEVDKVHLNPPEHVQYVCNGNDFFDCAEEEVVSLLQRRPEVHALDNDIDRLRARFHKSGLAQDGLVALLAQVPRAVLAQLQMDQFPHGYRNKQERLLELIDFNDTLVSIILGVNDDIRKQFAERAKQAADRICKRVGAPCFTNDQWTAIIRGLTREVAVYLAAREHGFNAWLTDRAHDALGVDIQIQDPEDGRYINLDVKTPSSFRHRMEQLVHENRLTEHELLRGDQQSYIIEHNGHGNRKVEIIVLCILPDLFGDLADWRFVQPESMRHVLNKLIREHGLRDGRYGINLAP